MLAADLVRAGATHVVGLDLDGAVLDRAKTRHHGYHNIEWMHGDLMRVPLEAESFDAVTSVAALHQMDAVAALRRCRRLVRPGGTVAIVGLAASEWKDLPFAVLAVISRQAFGMIYGHWQHSAPQCWPPPLTYREMRHLAERELPGSQYRRHLLGRYSIVWRKPAVG